MASASSGLAITLASHPTKPSFDLFDPMISWIQKYFQHHFKTIFAVLLAVTIISFIFTIGASPGIGRGDRRFVERQFFGYNLSMAEDVQHIRNDASISVGLQYGPMAGIDDEQIQQYGFQRTAALALADQWHIPASSTAEIKEAITKLRMFAGPNGEFDAKAYAAYRDSLKKNQRGLTEAEIARVIGDDVRIDKVNKLIAGPGYILPRDVKAQLERADTTWTIATATADYAAFKPEIKVTDAELTQYFSENAGRYEIPPRVVASYVEFPSAQFAASVTASEADVRAYYDMNPMRFPKPPEVKPADGKTAPKPSTPDADYAAVRQQVHATYVLEQAQKLAIKAASDLQVAIFDAKVVDENGLNTLLATRKLQAKSLAPFTRAEGPAELDHSPEVANEAFNLNKDHFVSDAIPSRNGAVILFWKDLQPAHPPQFAEVREKVAADYLENEKRKRFVELGKTAKAQIVARLKAGDTFDKAAAAAASSTGLKLEAKSIAPFSMRTRPQDLDYTAASTLDRLNKGDVSDMAVTADKGVFVYAADKKLPNASESNPQFVEMKNQMASMSAMTSANAYLSELVQRELKRSEPKPE